MGRILFVLACAGLVTAPADAVSIEFGKNRVVVEEVTEGGEVLLLGVSKKWENWKQSLERTTEMLPDSNLDGSVEFELAEPVSVGSVWLAVDLATGAWAGDGPSGSPMRVLEADAAVIPTPATLRVHLAANTLEVFLVRPLVGAWHLAVGEGGPKDRGLPEKRGIEIDFADSMPVGSTSELDAPAAGDLVLAIEPYRLEWFVSKIGDLPARSPGIGRQP